MRHILVVANQTVAAHDLLSALRSRAKEGPADVWMVVPATAPRDDHVTVSAGPAGGITPGTRDSGVHPDAFAAAERRLERGLLLVRDLGLHVNGEVGDSDPMKAVDDAVARHQFDEIIISTLPHPVSRWLRADLPARVARKHDVPVTTVTAHTFVDG